MDRDQWIKDDLAEIRAELKEIKADLKGVSKLVYMAMGAWVFLTVTIPAAIAAALGGKHGG